MIICRWFPVTEYEVYGGLLIFIVTWCWFPVTEHEVYQGLISVSQHSVRENNCILFQREIDDLYDHIDDPLAQRFCDVITDATGISGSCSETNGIAQAKLNTLKLTAQRALPRFNYCCTKVGLEHPARQTLLS